MATSTKGQQYWHAPVRHGRCNVRNMEGLAASVPLIAILLGVLLVVGASFIWAFEVNRDGVTAR